MAECLTAEFVAAINKAALAAMGDLIARRKWPRSHAGSPATVNALCAEIARLNVELSSITAQRETLLEALKSDCGPSDLFTALKNVKVADVYGKLFIGVIAENGCASAEIPEHSREIFLEWQKAQLVAIAKAEAPAAAVDHSSVEGEWSDDGRLTLLPSYYNHPNRVYCALLLTSDAAVTETEVAGWTSEQRKLAAEWALSVHAAASDNDDVIVPERPAFIAKAEGR